MIPGSEAWYARIDKNGEGGCWLWLGSKNAGGYASVTDKGWTRNGHRVSYEFYVGPIPAGLDIDHLCRVRNCLNPDHLEPVTRGENTRRGLAHELATQARRNIAARRTHCCHGHPWSQENTYIVPSTGQRQCIECKREAKARFDARQAAAA